MVGRLFFRMVFDDLMSPRAAVMVSSSGHCKASTNHIPWRFATSGKQLTMDCIYSDVPASRDVHQVGNVLGTAMQ